MDIIQAIILGIIQGVTEFLPISSSGHLVVAQNVMGLKNPGVIVETVLHLGTLFSILFYYFNDICSIIKNAINNKRQSRRYLINLVVATLPAVIFGLFLNDLLESAFRIELVKYTFLITGLIIGSTYFFKKNKSKELTLLLSFIIGLSQVIALLPGISRSGITISIAIMLGINRSNATKFSFFMAIPILIGAGILNFFTFDINYSISYMALFFGFFSSMITGYLMINFLLSVVSNGKFYLFSIYCFILAFFIFIY